MLAAFCALLAAFLRAVSELLTTQLLRFRRDVTSGVATEVVEALRREEAAKAKAAKEAEAARLTAQVKGDTLVVEGMGSIMDFHASPRRNLHQENYAKEAIVHYNGPPLNLAEGIVKEALDTRFPSKKFKGGWHFGSSDGSVQKHRGKLKFQVLSKVIHRLKHTAAKYSFFNKPGGKAGGVRGGGWQMLFMMT